MLYNFLIMSGVGFLFALGYTHTFSETIKEKEMEYEMLKEKTKDEVKLMAQELDDANLRLSKVSYTLIELRNEIHRLKGSK